MPDWSYRTVFRPLFFRLPPATARDLCLGFMGKLARVPLGPAFIDFLGHMRPPPRLRRALFGIAFPTPVGLGAEIDADAVALAALARFGLGYLEVGPVTAQPLPAAEAIELLAGRQAISYPEPCANPGVDVFADRLARATPLGVPLLVRLGYAPGSDPEASAAGCQQVMERLARYADAFILMTAAQASEEGWDNEQWTRHVRSVTRAAQEFPPQRPLLVGVPPDLDPHKADFLIHVAIEAGVVGVAVVGGVRSGASGRLLGRPARDVALRLVREVRERWGDRLPVIASGGIHEPEHALEFLRAGARLVQIDSGLVYSGPGLPKRVNEAVGFFESPSAARPTEVVAPRAAEMTWFWTTLLGISMLAGGLLALVIAATRVVLPYDEAFVGMTREQFRGVNDRLLAFMAHDRVTLAGTMVSVGILYLGLSLFGVRRGNHWARVAVLTSAFSGFGSFFLFLGFGYFDPFHAFVTAVLFQFLLLGLHARLGEDDPTLPNLREDWRWRWSQWGQLLFVIQGAVLIVAGAVIAGVGVTTVFVPEDLEFMNTTAEALAAANPRLVPVVAHDRASFGGMLIACGLAVLLSALWGFRQGAGWLWWTLLLSGSAGYAAAVGVHLAVGYTNWWHLAPAFSGAAGLAAGLALSHPYLCDRAGRRL
jgi:dihydroorotate dehydrogenase